MRHKFFLNSLSIACQVITTLLFFLKMVYCVLSTFLSCFFFFVFVLLQYIYYHFILHKIFLFDDFRTNGIFSKLHLQFRPSPFAVWFSLTLQLLSKILMSNARCDLSVGPMLWYLVVQYFAKMFWYKENNILKWCQSDLYIILIWALLCF